MKTRTKSLILMVLLIALLVLFSTVSSAADSFKIDNISAIVNDTKAEIEWAKVDGATGYEVYVDLPAIGYQYIGTVKSNGVQIIGFDEGETYGVKVRAYKTVGSNVTYSDFSTEVRFKFGEDTTTTSSLGKIGEIEAISYGATGSLKWDKVTNADGYQIFAKVGNGNFVDMGTTTSTDIKLIGMQADKVYTIKVRPYIEISGEKVYGTFSDSVILKYEEEPEEDVKIDRVTNFTVSVSGTRAYLTWNSLSNVDGYEILVEMPGGTEAVYSSDTNKLTLQNFTEGYRYKAKVRAYKYVNGTKVYGSYSSTKYIEIEEKEKIKLDRVTDLKVTVTGQKAKFTWDRVSGADGYEIEIYRPDRGYYTTTTSSTSKMITGFEYLDEKYTVRVRAYKNVNGTKIYGNYSSKKYFRGEQEAPGKVTDVRIIVYNGEAEVTWDKVSGVDGYELRIYKPGKGYETVRTTKTSKTIYNTVDNKRYTVQVRAYVNADGERKYGDYSDKVDFLGYNIDLDKVTGLRTAKSGSRVTLKWDRVDDADGYEITIYEPDGDSYTRTTTTNSKRITGISNKSGYKFKVRAYVIVNGEKGYGPYSTRKSF